MFHIAVAAIVAGKLTTYTLPQTYPTREACNTALIFIVTLAKPPAGARFSCRGGWTI
jgi:hypothetical protein